MNCSSEIIYLNIESCVIEYELIKFNHKNDISVLTIISSSFNQEVYVDNFFRGINEQITKYSFELLIFDDASTDHTIDFICKNASKCNFPITLIKFKENSSHLPSLKQIETFRYLSSDYFAFCEMDDFWNNEKKIDTQINSLINNPAFSWSITKAIRFDMSTGERLIMLDMPEDSNANAVSTDLALLAWGQLPTCTMFFRREVFVLLINFIDGNFRKNIVEHLFVLIAIAIGNCAFIPFITGVYRYRRPLSFTETVVFDDNKKIQFYDVMSRYYVDIAVKFPNKLLRIAVLKLVIWQQSQVLLSMKREILLDIFWECINNKIELSEKYSLYILGQGYMGSFIATSFVDKLSFSGVIGNKSNSKWYGLTQMSLENIQDSLLVGQHACIIVTPLGISKSIIRSIEKKTNLKNIYFYPLGDIVLERLIEGPLNFCTQLFKFVSDDELASAPTTASKGPLAS